MHSTDNDVLVLLLHHRPIIKSAMLFMLTGKEGKNTNLSRFIPIHTLYKKPVCIHKKSSQYAIMLQECCLTVCDTVCDFHGHGKKTAFRIMMKKANSLQALSSIGLGSLIETQKKTCT